MAGPPDSPLLIIVPIRSLSGVDAFVSAEAALAGEHFPADLAHDWSARVHPQSQSVVERGRHERWYGFLEQILHLDREAVKVVNNKNNTNIQEVNN